MNKEKRAAEKRAARNHKEDVVQRAQELTEGGPENRRERKMG